MVDLSVSLLGYESCLDGSMYKIQKIIEAGADWLHVDAMSPNFIKGKFTFNRLRMSYLYSKFSGEVKFDFHLMSRYPNFEIEAIDEIVKEREETMITIHREAYRENLGKYNSKKYDLLKIEGLEDKDKQPAESVCKTLKDIKEKGYLVGLALEPEISLENITTDEMLKFTDMILFMGVSSGAGGQEYRDEEVTPKIREAEKFGKIIQVDGGINDKTLPTVLDAGVDNVVIGSYITGAEDVVERVKYVKSFLS